MNCRVGCAACCIEISISSPIPGMPHGKPAGARCPNLNKENQCNIHNSDLYPEVCRSYSATQELCGHTTSEAIENLKNLEVLTCP